MDKIKIKKRYIAIFFSALALAGALGLQINYMGKGSLKASISDDVINTIGMPDMMGVMEMSAPTAVDEP